ncbi:hypothetical protein AM469_001570 [Pseudomonas aeruginosa]|nr:hypothetical protein AM469_001570 [Pseudomonas aeruginosa]
MAEIEFDIDAYEPLPVSKPKATRVQAEKVLAMLDEAERPLLVAGGGIFNADAAERFREFAELTGIPVIPTLMGWGVIPDDHPQMAGMVGLQTSHRYGNATLLESDLVLGIGNRWANRHTRQRRGLYRRSPLHPCRHRTDPDRPGVHARPGHRLRRRRRPRRIPRSGPRMEGRRQAEVARRLAGKLPAAQTHAAAQDPLRQRAGETAARLRRDERVLRKDACYVSTIGLSQIAGAQFLHVYQPRHWINCGQAGPLGWTIPAALGVVKADPSRQVVALSGDYDFQFMIEELAVGAQFKLPYIHVLVNNSYLGLIRQAQRGFDMDYCVQLAFDNINAPELEGYGVDHVAVVEGLGCKAIRVFDPNEIGAALAKARELMQQHQVPVVVEVILERVTNISMGTEINAINEFEELAEKGADAPTAISLLD